MDDERAIREVCREVAQSLGFNTAVADSAEHAYRLLDTQNIDVVLLDLKLPGAGGLEALHQIGERKPDAVIVVVTGYGTVQSAVQAMKNGAYDYVTKPFSMEELRLLLERVSGHLKLKTENRTLREKIKSKLGFGSIVGRAPEMEKLYRIIGKAAHSSHPVLILGESGTGKEMVARSIHFSGPFRDKPFIPVDCGSLVPTLIESELFGYVKGAFTGAVQSRDGLLAIAEGGTVFLDEVGELPVDLQAKLLRAIQEREIRPVGSTKRIAINVRILAATNRDLEQAVAQGTFRRDLYFRLNVLSLKIPPLRERRQDIPLLTGYFLERLSRASGHERTLSDEAMKALLAYDWPGNVRELENCLERACAFTSGPVIQVGDLPSAIHGVPGHIATDGETARPKSAHGGTGEADHPEHDRPAQRRQAAGGANAGHRQDHALPQAQGVRCAGLRSAAWLPALNNRPNLEQPSRAGNCHLTMGVNPCVFIARIRHGTCNGDAMLLVITPSAKARGCAQTIQQVTSEETHVAATLSQALAQLRAQEYVAVLIDQAFLETEPVESDMVLEHIGTAIPVHVNFAISGMDRVVRDLRAALHRHKKEVHVGAAGGPASAAERTERARSQRSCFPAKWRCKSPILQSGAESQNADSSRACAARARAKLEGPGHRRRSRRSTPPADQSARAVKCNIVCATSFSHAFARKSFCEHPPSRTTMTQQK